MNEIEQKKAEIKALEAELAAMNTNEIERKAEINALEVEINKIDAKIKKLVEIRGNTIINKITV